MIPVLVHHLRFHKSLEAFEKRIGYSFSSRALLQTAFTHTSYEENFGTNPDHARNSLSNCGIRKPKYGNCQIQYARKKSKCKCVKSWINILLCLSHMGLNWKGTLERRYNFKTLTLVIIGTDSKNLYPIWRLSEEVTDVFAMFWVHYFALNTP